MTPQAEAARKVYDALRPQAVWVCDAYPRCRFEGTRDEVRAHRRECLLSPTGDLYRVHTWRPA